MGCGESKHDVATGNTITKTKGQKSKDGSSMQQQQEENNNDANSKQVGAQKEYENDENEDSKEGDEKEKRENEWNSSGDNVEAVISDGMSGKTVYYSPNNNKVNDVPDDDERSNDGEEEKGSVEYTIEEMKKKGL